MVERTSLRSWARLGGSVLVILGAIALVSTDLETAVALMVLCVVAGYTFQAGVASADGVGLIRRSMGPRAKVAVGTLCVVGLIAVAASDVADALALVAIVVLGYVGYRSGSVFRGAVYGITLGVVGSIVVVCLFAVAVGLGAYSAGGIGALLFTVAFPLTAVAFLLWAGLVLLVGALGGLVCGSVGGAIARVTHGVE
ncbi:hypothetical protein ACFR99_13845 [Haloarchaeobius amylolyticus]|uniref:Uncharacterized protein n=1 Tax=Haloarchaeobius amylolyticus TaxID=1198296 RepID=A0ABD6BIX2_9EURY